MITELEVENFKAFGMKQRARFARITLIYGGNSSGKSTLIQSLLLLKQSMELSRTGTSRSVMSPDGKTRTITTTSMNAQGQP